MAVSIFSAQLMNKPNYETDPAEQRENALETLEHEVNDVLVAYPTATVEWLQSSAACKYGAYTQVTAILRY